MEYSSGESSDVIRVMQSSGDCLDGSMDNMLSVEHASEPQSPDDDFAETPTVDWMFEQYFGNEPDPMEVWMDSYFYE